MNINLKITPTGQELLKVEPDKILSYWDNPKAIDALNNLAKNPTDFKIGSESLLTLHELEKRGFIEVSAQADLSLPQPSIAEQIQIQRSQQIAPIIKDYLQLKGVDYDEGKVYAARWDKERSQLSVIDRRTHSFKMMATQEGEEWRGRSIPLDVPNVPNLTEADVHHFEKVAQKIQDLQQANAISFTNSSLAVAQSNEAPQNQTPPRNTQTTAQKDNELEL